MGDPRDPFRGQRVYDGVYSLHDEASRAKGSVGANYLRSVFHPVCGARRLACPASEFELTQEVRFIVENIEVHVMFLRPDHLGGRNVRVTMVGRSEVLRLHGRTYARRGVFHSVLGGASRTQRFIVRTRRPTRMGENRAERSLKWVNE